MALTRAAVENELVVKMRGKLANQFWTMSVLVNGSNPDLNGPIRRAVRSLGGGVANADGLTVSDADLAPFTGWIVEKLIDQARVEVIKDCIGQAALCDVQADTDLQKLSQIEASLLAELTYLEQRLIEPYGLDLSPATIVPMSGRGMPNDPLNPCRTRTSRRNWPYPP